MRPIFISASPSAVESVFSSTAQAVDGASNARALPAAMLPIRMPEPFRNSRRASGRFSRGTSPAASSHPPPGAAAAAAMVIGITRMTCLPLWLRASPALRPSEGAVLHRHAGRG